MLFNIKILNLNFAAVLIYAVSGAPNTRDSEDLKNTQFQETIYNVQNVINCKTSGEYLNLSDFNFNPRQVLEEDRACLSLRMFKDMGFIQHFSIPVNTLYKFILNVQKGYWTIPYHNWSHGFAVLHFCFTVLKTCKLIEKHNLTPLEGLALLTAAMCHDIDHPGTNNQFQKAINSSLAQMYAEEGSILENHHIDLTLGLLNNSETNFVAHLDEAKQRHLKDIIRSVILATDLSVHFKLVPEEKMMAAEGFDYHNNRHRELLQFVIISCADLSDQTKDWTTVRYVVKLIFKEFFAQGDREKQLGLVPTKMMDCTQANIPRLQIDFISKIVIPDFQVFLTIYPETQTCMNNIQNNLKYWLKAVPYFEEQISKGRNQMDILSDNKLDNISTWP